MYHSQMKYMLNHPAALMKYHMTRQAPSMRKPTQTPLWVCLSKMTPRDRLDTKNIHLNPKLGYNCSLHFANAEQVFDYLGENRWIVGNQILPSESRIISSFKKTLTPADLT